MLFLKIGCLAIVLSILLTGCSTSLHGSFAAISYIDKSAGKSSKAIGPVRGESCQTRVLYLFPVGPATSTSEAIQAAKKQYQGTNYIADISIDDRTNWKFGYSVQCITVDAIAY